MLSHILEEWLRLAFEKVLGGEADLSAIGVTATSNPSFGAYQCNACMSLAKERKRPPREIAEAVVSAASPLEAVSRLEVAGPGFINIHMDDTWLAERVGELTMDDRLGVPEVGQGHTIVMDYGGPNITKPLHIGHLRSPNIGSAVDRMHRFLGYRVISDNHLGDWGTQFGITIIGFREFGDEDEMKRVPMEELQRVYVKSYERAGKDEAWMQRCRSELVKLQQGDPENRALWRRFVDLSLKELGRIYERLGVE
ncbi:MAG: arginine--tRNA ligase, partial [Lentisphaerae bacterium]|nr:arginine--tRNA ligase [Lentisphaerota bacterium]